MNLIEFKNKPDTTTPINKTNLNHNFKEIKEKIEEMDLAFAKQYIIATSTGQTTLQNNTNIPLIKTRASGTKLKIQDNKIIIGADVSRVEVSGNIFMDITQQSNGYLWGRIVKNANHVSGSLHPLLSGMAFVSTPIASTIIDVKEGDLIYLNVDAAGAVGTTRDGDVYTWLCVKVIE